MARNELTEDNKAIIVDSLKANEWAVRAAYRNLKERGFTFARGTVGNVAMEVKNEEAVASRLAAAEARIRSLQNTNTHLRKWYGESLKFNDEILSALQTIPPPKLVKPIRAHTSERNTPACAPAADWHYSEVIDEEEMEGFNKYNTDIAARRVAFLSDKEIKWILTERHGHRIDEVHIPILGDMVTGNIHDELITYAEFPLPVAVVNVSHLLAEKFISPFCAHFDVVHVHFIKTDNHSRLTKKKGSKRRSTNSYNHIIAEMVRLLLRDHKNVHWHEYKSQKAEIDIGGQIILTDHGDSVRSYQGLPFGGFAREDGREAVKRMRAGRKFDDRMRAHWHQAGAGPFGIMCGCLCGSTELDAISGRWSKPYQVSFLTHPDHGWYNFCRWDLSGIR